jgi:hypothetical protein
MFMKCEICHRTVSGTEKWYEKLFYPVSSFCFGGHNVPVSQLVPLFVPSWDDVILISDVSEMQSKKITIDQLCKLLKKRL